MKYCPIVAIFLVLAVLYEVEFVCNFLGQFRQVQNTEFDFFFSDFSLPEGNIYIKLVLKIMLWLLKELFGRVDKQNHLTPDFHCKLCILLNLYTTKKLAKKVGD